MKSSLPKRIFQAGLLGFYRNRTVSLSSVMILTITLFILTAFYFFRAIFDYTLVEIRDKVDVRIYFTGDATEDQMNDVKAKLLGLPEVKSVVFTSRNQAYADFKDRHANDQLTLQALDELGDNPFGASLAVQAKDTSQYERIAESLSTNSSLLGSSQSAIDKINYFQLKDSIDKLNSIIGWVNTVGFWISMIFIAMSCMIVYNTIRLAIFVYRDEISIMKLVGASNWFIRGPFIIESMLYGITATVLTLIISYPITMWISKKTVFFFEGMNLHSYYLQHFFSLAGLLLLSSIVLSGVSAFFAVRKYLKV